MSGNRGMVQVLGTTYRIVARADRHEVVRVLDDQLVGAFRNRPALHVVRSEIDTDLLLDVAREALQRARIAWSPARPKGALSSWLSAIQAKWCWMLDMLMGSLAGLLVLGPAPRSSARHAAAACAKGSVA